MGNERKGVGWDVDAEANFYPAWPAANVHNVSRVIQRVSGQEMGAAECKGQLIITVTNRLTLKVAIAFVPFIIVIIVVVVGHVVVVEELVGVVFLGLGAAVDGASSPAGIVLPNNGVVWCGVVRGEGMATC